MNNLPAGLQALIDANPNILVVMPDDGPMTSDVMAEEAIEAGDYL